MIIPDTSIWVEYLKQNFLYYENIKNLMENQRILAVECIFAELLQGAKNKREREILFSYWENLPKISGENIWIEAGKYSSENKLISKGVGIIDCVILLSARQSNAKIFTLDKKLLKLLKNEEKFIS